MNKAVSWTKMVADPVKGGMTILANQIHDRDQFIHEKGLTEEFRVWLENHQWQKPE